MDDEDFTFRHWLLIALMAAAGAATVAMSLPWP